MWTKKDCLEAAARGEGCLGKAGNDEPVFILRGQDITMPSVLVCWAELVESMNGGLPTIKSVEARKFALETIEWQKTHPAKTPD